MVRGKMAELNMQKMLLVGKEADEKTYSCEVLEYDESGESVFLLLRDGILTDISLDAVYRCSILQETGSTECTGRIRERYCDEMGNILKLQVENGFYKINIK